MTGEDCVARKTSRRLVVEDDDGVAHVAYEGMTKIVGFTLCKVGVKFKANDDLPHFEHMRLSERRASCVFCIGADDEDDPQAR